MNVLGPLRRSRDNRHNEWLIFQRGRKARNPGCEFISPTGILEDMEGASILFDSWVDILIITLLQGHFLAD